MQVVTVFLNHLRDIRPVHGNSIVNMTNTTLTCLLGARHIILNQSQKQDAISCS